MKRFSPKMTQNGQKSLFLSYLGRSWAVLALPLCLQMQMGTSVCVRGSETPSINNFTPKSLKIGQNETVFTQNDPKWPKITVFELSQPFLGRFGPTFVLADANGYLCVRERVRNPLNQ